MDNLTLEQKKLLDEIMYRENPQREVDEIVNNTKIALDICENEKPQKRVDEIVKNEIINTKNKKKKKKRKKNKKW